MKKYTLLYSYSRGHYAFIDASLYYYPEKILDSLLKVWFFVEREADSLYELFESYAGEIVVITMDDSIELSLTPTREPRSIYILNGDKLDLLYDIEDEKNDKI